MVVTIKTINIFPASYLCVKSFNLHSAFPTATADFYRHTCLANTFFFVRYVKSQTSNQLCNVIYRQVRATKEAVTGFGFCILERNKYKMFFH